MKIAAININKHNGGRSISYKELEKKYRLFKDTIVTQVKLIKPDIVICCGVFWLIHNERNEYKVEDHEPDYEFMIVNNKLNKIRAHFNPHRIFVETLHPNQRTISHQMYYESILENVGMWMKTHGKF